MTYPIKRDLDPAYFRVEREGKWESLCFTDLTEKERDGVINGRPESWLRQMVTILAGSLRDLGDRLNVEYVREDEL